MYKRIAVMLCVVFLAAQPVTAQVEPTFPAGTVAAPQESQGPEITTVIVDGQEYSLEEFEERFGDEIVDWVEDPEAEAQGKLFAFTREGNITVAPRAVNKRCQMLAGSYQQANYIEMCEEITTNVSPRTAVAHIQVRIGPYATRATGCKLTGWVVLYKGDQKWASPRQTSDCTWALRTGRWAHVYKSTGTTATYAHAQGCVDLYFNNSPYSGWQACRWSEKVGFN